MDTIKSRGMGLVFTLHTAKMGEVLAVVEAKKTAEASEILEVWNIRAAAGYVWHGCSGTVVYREGSGRSG